MSPAAGPIIAQEMKDTPALNIPEFSEAIDRITRKLGLAAYDYLRSSDQLKMGLDWLMMRLRMQEAELAALGHPVPPDPPARPDHSGNGRH